MKHILIAISMVILRCCWGGPSDYTLMLHSQNNSSALKDLNGSYHIIQLNNDNVSSYHLNINFNKETNQVSGFSGCNRFFGAYSQKGNQLKFGELGATKMLCDDKKNNLESAFFKVLQKANTILFSDNGFSIFQDKKLLLVAEKENLKSSKVSFEYTDQSRSHLMHLKINKKQVSYNNTLDNETYTFQCPDENWNAILEAYNAVDVKNIPNLKAPSQKRLYDGASIAKLKIIVDGKTYLTPSFDHGNPHPDIAKLVKVILSVMRNVE